jgi:methylated-DNA-protein-cysteine methyltransferase-like protein
MGNTPLYSCIYRIVSHVPPGTVATYGQIARLAGMPGRARQVGYALHNLPGNSPVPWHRVVNREGRISLSGRLAQSHQRSLLESEGIVFDEHGAIALKKYQWRK